MALATYGPRSTCTPAGWSWRSRTTRTRPPRRRRRPACAVRPGLVHGWGRCAPTARRWPSRPGTSSSCPSCSRAHRGSGAAAHPVPTVVGVLGLPQGRPGRRRAHAAGSSTRRQPDRAERVPPRTRCWRRCATTSTCRGRSRSPVTAAARPRARCCRSSRCADRPARPSSVGASTPRPSACRGVGAPIHSGRGCAARTEAHRATAVASASATVCSTGRAACSCARCSSSRPATTVARAVVALRRTPASVS